MKDLLETLKPQLTPLQLIGFLDYAKYLPLKQV
jgi:hypothetical protein